MLSSLFLATALFPVSASGLLTETWAAKWIEVPSVAPEAYGAFHFRRSFEWGKKTAHFPVHVSGDSCYQLFVNGVHSSWGPARSDLTHWRYETVDLSPHLPAGKNTLAAVVSHRTYSHNVKALAVIARIVPGEIHVDYRIAGAGNSNGSGPAMRSNPDRITFR
jgi:hypothetical protein